MFSVSYRPFRGKTTSVSGRWAGLTGIPGNPIAYFKNGMVDSIGLSVDDYDAVGATFQPVFYSDSSTPILHTLAEWIPILLAHPSINLESVTCTEAKGFSVHPVDTSLEIMNKVRRWFGLSQVFDEVLFGGETVTFGGDAVTF